MESEAAVEILERYAGDESALIRALQDIQEHYNYLPEEALQMTAERLGVPLTQVLRAATFYKAFSLEPRGKHCIDVCLGTACHVRGGQRILSRLQRELDVEPGGTTDDMQFSLEIVRCLGCCSVAPVARIDGDVHGHLRQDKAPQLLRRYGGEE